MAWRSVFTICILMLGMSLVIGSPSSTADDGGSDVDMREIRLLLQKHESQIESLQRTNVLLEEKSAIFEEKSAILEGTVLTLEEKVMTLEKKVNTFEQNDPNTDQKESIKADPDVFSAANSSSLSDSKIRSSQKHQGSAIKKINKRVDSTTDSIIAFHAILTHTISNPTGDHIVQFDKIVTNIGGHFNSKSGVFTCVEVGAYQFSWMIKVFNNQYIVTELVRNGVVIGTGMSGDDNMWTTGSASSITMLVPGDSVWVRVSGDHSQGVDIYPTFTMFNGFLLH
ncbi:otolin-1-like [Pecten maximus]|uniref:otolin-1-like n=1 Tax=Pecten maximus TaxID=6579 RepID=UPI0014588AB4|nr:otolin-1-like [Pecten maximus]